MIENNMHDSNEGQRHDDYFKEIQGFHQTEDNADCKQSISSRIFDLRTKNGLSYQQLAKLSNLSEQLIEKIEKQETYPDLGTVLKLSRALKVAASLLLEDESGYAYSITRKEQRPLIKRQISGSAEKPHYVYQSLVKGIETRHMQALVVTLSKSEKQPQPTVHQGEEFIVVQEGSVKITLHHKQEILHPGDSIYYLSTIPHLLEPAEGFSQAVILAVLYSGD
jgi:transcriptional regulator with XRE-family HTH domain